jgi:tetratricopeptide (TPR) repeat protein
VTIGQTTLQYKADPADGVMNRPVQTPENFDWNSVQGIYIQGKEFLQQRYYDKAEEKLKAALHKDPNYLPALGDLSMLAYRNMDYKTSLEYARHALSIDTYDPAGNFYYGLANVRLGNLTDAKDGFDIASLSPSFRGAAYSELGKLYAREKEFSTAIHYANRSLELNAGNADAYQILATVHRLTNQQAKAESALEKLKDLTPLNHFIRFEKYRWIKSDAEKKEFVGSVRSELPHETFLQLADWYWSVGQPEESLVVLSLAPQNPEVLYWMAYLAKRLANGNAKEYLDKANRLSPHLVFPFRSTSAEILEWVITQTTDWKPKYYLALIHWSRNHTDRAQELFSACGNPEFAPFYAARATIMKNEHYSRDLHRAAQLDPAHWRYGKLLVDHFIDQKDYPEALRIAADYHRRFPQDFRLSMVLAKAYLLNNQYKATTDLLDETTILPYEGATDGRQLYREAWLMQAISQIHAKNYKTALSSINKAKVWPENLGAGKPYDEDIDSRLENYLEGLVYEKTKKPEQAKKKFTEVSRKLNSERNQANDLLTALSLKKLNRKEEGEKLLQEWLDKDPQNRTAQWAYAIFQGKSGQPIDDGGNGNTRLIGSLIEVQ